MSFSENSDVGFCDCGESSDSYEESEKLSISYGESEKSEEKLTLWESILQESENQKTLILEWQKLNDNLELEKLPCESVKYLNKEVFPVLLPAMEKMLNEARKQNVIKVFIFRFLLHVKSI